jgi:F-type H+-transporting ATPase subunit b
LRPPARASALIAIAVSCAASGFALAAENGSGQPSSFLDFLGKVINFMVLFGALGYFLRKPLAKFLADKVDFVRSGLTNAEKTALESQAKLQAVKARTGTLESEIEGMKAKAGADGRAEKDRILQAARQEAARLKMFSEQEIDSQVRASVRHLKEYAAEKALALALDRLAARLTPESHSRLIDASIDKLAEVHAERNSRPALRPRTH